ncbi:UDP-N-acetylmuramate--L-alanine ligase [Acidothermaceae bacterium B102]|nr:UDP-N-acetylmuramate--L-alanine ligase [Acidothermaceae bacterium B102]
MTTELGRVHFIGIGGAGMSGIARILLARGVPVSGSDAKDSTMLAALRALGARIDVGHHADNVDEVDTVVVSSAIRQSNPELVEARARGLTVLLRAAALAAVMAGRKGIAVAGTAGKTTTTSMLTVALQHCGVDPSFAIGGDLNEPGSGAHNGTGELFVAEADESDGSFLLLSPFAAVVTNVEPDHLDHYADDAAVEAAFVAFSQTLDPQGFLVTCADDAGARRVAAAASANGAEVISYGTADDADLRIDGLRLDGHTSEAEIVYRGRRMGTLRLQVPGDHNVRNAAATLAVGLRLGLSFDQLAAGLAGFRGARRRFELKGVEGGVRVYDDYAHHPTKLTAALRAAREVAGEGRLVVAFQPHLFSRTEAFAREFGRALALADEVVVMDVYAAREDPVPGVTGALVADAVPLPYARVTYQPSWSAVAADLVARAAAGDLVMTIGAGDVTMIGPEVLSLLASGGPGAVAAPTGGGQR